MFTHNTSSSAYKIALAALLACIAAGGSMLCAFIFTCGMKSMDGPAGGSNEAMPMMILFSVIPIYCAVGCFLSLKRRYYSRKSQLLGYWPVLGTVVYFGLAMLTALSLGHVEWGNTVYQLQGLARDLLLIAIACFAVSGLHLITVRPTETGSM